MLRLGNIKKGDMPKETKAKENKILFKNNPGMIFVMIYFILFAVNAVVIYFANMMFPDKVVLSTMSLSSNWSVLLSAGKLALIATFLMPFFTEWEIRRKRVLSPAEWMGGYLLVNAAALWCITRFSEVFGLGVTSWVVVVVLAAVIDFAQGMAMMVFGKVTGNKS